MEVIWNRTCLDKQAKQGCVNKDRIVIFGYTVALTLSVYSQKAPGTASHNNGVCVCVCVCEWYCKEVSHCCVWRWPPGGKRPPACWDGVTAAHLSWRLATEPPSAPPAGRLLPQGSLTATVSHSSRPAACLPPDAQ